MEKIFFVQTHYGSHKIILEHDKRRGYVATAPGLEGVITWGKNIVHAKNMAREAIELCIESLVQKKSNTKSSTRHSKNTYKTLVRA